MPYLSEVGKVIGYDFTPTDGFLPYRLSYGVVCELVHLHARRSRSPITALTYRDVAEYITKHSANTKSYSAPIHMTVREIFKTCYPGFGAATGSSGVAPGVMPGGSSTKGNTSGTMVGKGLAKLLDKGMSDAEFRKRLELQHEFFALVNH